MNINIKTKYEIGQKVYVVDEKTYVTAHEPNPEYVVVEAHVTSIFLLVLPPDDEGYNDYSVFYNTDAGPANPISEFVVFDIRERAQSYADYKNSIIAWRKGESK